MRRFEAERQPTVGVTIEDDAQAFERGYGSRCSRGDAAGDRRIGEAVARGERVVGMQ